MIKSRWHYLAVIQDAYDDLVEVFAKPSMMDEPEPKAIKMLRETLNEASSNRVPEEKKIKKQELNQ